MSNEWLLKWDPAWIVYISTLLILEGGPGLGAVCTGVLRIMEPKGRILKCDSQTFILTTHVSCCYSVGEFLLLWFFNSREILIRIYKKNKADKCLCENCWRRFLFCPLRLAGLVSGTHQGTCTHTSQCCFLCIVLFPTFFLVSANSAILITSDMSGALQLWAATCLSWLRSHRMSRQLSGIYLFRLQFWQQPSRPTLVFQGSGEISVGSIDLSWKHSRKFLS